MFNHKDNYLKQLPAALRNVELTLDGILEITKHPLKAALVLSKVKEMVATYSLTQRKIKDRGHFLVYTDIDHKIPFRPEEDNLYIYMITSLMSVFGEELVKKSSREELKPVLDAFIKVNYQGAEVLKIFPQLCLDLWSMAGLL